MSLNTYVASGQHGSLMLTSSASDDWRTSLLYTGRWSSIQNTKHYNYAQLSFLVCACYPIDRHYNYKMADCPALSVHNNTD